MDQDMITDITLDHLPDLSDASVSFQIPATNASAELLLADDTGGFDVLCSAVDDVSFAPVAHLHPRGRPLALGQRTPRVQRVQGTPRPPPRPSSSPTPGPPRTASSSSSSAKPPVVPRPLSLGHASPDKARKTPSPAKPRSGRRPPESPLVSSERFRQLRADVASLDLVQPASHVRMEAMASGEMEDEGDGSSHADSKNENDAPHVSEDLLGLIPEEKDALHDVEPSADRDIVMATGDGSPADETHITVAGPMPKPSRNPRTSSKPTVAVGGISKRTTSSTTHVSKKTKGKPPHHVREARPAPPSAVRRLNPPQSIDSEETLVPPACTSGEVESKSETTQIAHTSTGRLAERLVSYSQRLISSIGLYKPSPESSFIEAPGDAARAVEAQIESRPPATSSPQLQRISDIPSPHSEPFRLSEISPHKQPLKFPKRNSPANTGTLQDGGRAISPMRPAKKRASMDAGQPPERRGGREKMVLADAERGSSNEAVSEDQLRPAKRSRVHEDPPVTHPDVRNSAQRSDSRSTLPSARTKYKPSLTPPAQCKGPTLNGFPYASRSRQVHERLIKSDEWRSKAANIRSGSTLGGIPAGSRLRRARPQKAIESTDARQRSGPSPAADLPLIEKKPNATLSVAQLTKPVGFTFRVDARLGVRNVEERLAVSEPGKTHPLHPVPDVKAYRSSHHAAFTVHKDGVVPSVPVVPFFFCTEQRAKEREKFDDMVKRKEEETHRLNEERRRRKAEEEERAIKEMRRKAVPKANEIPEWYADMPKRKGTAV